MNRPCRSPWFYDLLGGLILRLPSWRTVHGDCDTDSQREQDGFVKEFLNVHPQANTRAVNEAWGAAGFARGTR